MVYVRITMITTGIGRYGSQAQNLPPVDVGAVVHNAHYEVNIITSDMRNDNFSTYNDCRKTKSAGMEYHQAGSEELSYINDDISVRL